MSLDRTVYMYFLIYYPVIPLAILVLIVCLLASSITIFVSEEFD